MAAFLRPAGGGDRRTSGSTAATAEGVGSAGRGGGVAAGTRSGGGGEAGRARSVVAAEPKTHLRKPASPVPGPARLEEPRHGEALPVDGEWSEATLRTAEDTGGSQPGMEGASAVKRGGAEGKGGAEDHHMEPGMRRRETGTAWRSPQAVRELWGSKAPPETPGLQVPPQKQDQDLDLVDSPITHQQHPSLESAPTDFDLYSMLRALPTRQENEQQLNAKLELQAVRLEGLVKRELRAVQESLTNISSKMEQAEQEFKKLENRVQRLEGASSTQDSHLLKLAMQIIDLENRQRRNNLRLRGIPESIALTDLKPTVKRILNHYLNLKSEEDLELDRVHRVGNPKRASPGRPRDVICRIHFFGQKETISRAAWEAGAYELEGNKIIILQDLASKTLKMRRLLKPVLDAVKKQGALYRWGFPFSLIVKFKGQTLEIKSPDQLGTLFDCLGIIPFEVPDWVQVALE